jgi:hypothetical protein
LGPAAPRAIARIARAARAETLHLGDVARAQPWQAAGVDVRVTGGVPMRRSIAALFVFVLASLAVAPAARATSPIQITKIYFDSPGTDNRSNSSRNAEYVTIKNKGSSNRSLDGWTLRDRSRHVYYFYGVTLRAGRSVTIHTGDGNDTSTNLYWGSGNYIWNNDGDGATLKNANGSTVDTCSYSGAGSSVTC